MVCALHFGWDGTNLSRHSEMGPVFIRINIVYFVAVIFEKNASVSRIVTKADFGISATPDSAKNPLWRFVDPAGILSIWPASR